MGEPVTIHAPDGAVIHTSRNLRGLLDHARRVGPPIGVVLMPRQRGAGDAQPYAMRCRFPDGSSGRARWADWRVAADWLRARRSWGTPGQDGPSVAGPVTFTSRALGQA